MSLEIVLVPLALAAVTTWKAARSGGDNTQAMQVASRLRDGALLSDALGDLGVRTDGLTESGIDGTVDDRAVSFHRNEEDLWVASFDGRWSEEDAVDLVTRLDAAYGLRVQQAVLAKIRERAPAAGMEVVTETVDDDRTVTLMLSVGRS